MKKYIKISNKNKFIIGILLIFIGLFLPFFLKVETFKIVENTYNSVVLKNDFLLINAATCLVLLNSLRALPHYLGAFFIGESLTSEKNIKLSKYIKIFSICLIIPTVYFLIFLIHNIKYHLGIPALTLILIIGFLGSKNYNYVSNFKKIILIILVIFTVQILDIMPLLGRFPIGKGEMSQEIKLVSKFLELDNFINICSTYIFILLFTLELLLLSLINSENNLKSMNLLREQNLMIKNKSRLQELENRNYLESRHLVHDLNSPLTAAQALVSLVKLNCESENRKQDYIYLNEVENSLESMSEMIYQTLYINKTSILSTNDIMDKIMSNISIYTYYDKVTIYNNSPNKFIKINPVFFIRSIINLLDNSNYAIKNLENGIIKIIVDSIKKDNVDYIVFKVIDNGVGIDKNNLKSIWKSGYTTKNTTGLGLPFVKNTIESNNGIISVDSCPNNGTIFKIYFKEVINREWRRKNFVHRWW